MRKALTGILQALLAAALGALAVGFAGAWHPAGDALAVFRIQIALAALALALALALIAPRGKPFALAGLAALALAAPVASDYSGAADTTATAPRLSIYQKNLNYRTADLEAIAQDIRASGADIVTLQEVSARNRVLMEALRPDYPVQAYCPHMGVGGTAVLSRLPAAGTPPVCAGGLTALRLDGPQGPLWAVSLHLFWPWPHQQADQVEDLLPVIAGLEGPVVLGGDFNMVPWGASVGRVADAARAGVQGPTVTTFRALGPLAPLAIDHVLLPQGWEGAKSLRPEFGSDHRGVLVGLDGLVGPDPQAPANR